MKNICFICLSLFIAISFSGCLKKGEDDPAISFRSRKGRVDGDWKVVSAKLTSSYTSFTNPLSSYSTVFTSNGNTYTQVSTDNGVQTSASGTFSEEWEFDKDGSYEGSYTMDGVHSSYKGKWNFTSGVGETKNKSQIVLTEETSTSTNGQTTYSGNYINDVYDIKELRNKKMVWYFQHTETNTDGTSSLEYEVELESEKD